MIRFRTCVTLFAAINSCCLFAGSDSMAQWSTDPTVNNAMCTDYYNQNQFQMVSDGTGGAIIAWVDYRFPPNYAIFAQRISSAGVVQWTINGIQVSSSSVNNERPSIVSDGSYGAIICWVTNGDFGNLYAQRVDATGTLLWPAGGVVLCLNSVSSQAIPAITSDGNGGAILAWADNRNNAYYGGDDVYAQRVDASGSVLWTANGVPVADTSGYQGASLQAASDGSGGAILVWEDGRVDATLQIYTQRISSGGSGLWNNHGVAIDSIISASLYPQLIGDAGGAIICWVDRRFGNSDWNIYAQKVGSGGALLWGSTGLPICLKAGHQDSPQLASDGNGGAVITWDEANAADPNTYAQRVGSNGVVRWATNGLPVCQATNAQRLPRLTSAGDGSVVITWIDHRANNGDIYAQSVDSGGSLRWTADGVAVSTAAFGQMYPQVINNDTNGFVVAWTDYRNDGSEMRADIYAQRVRADGSLGATTGIDDDRHARPSAEMLCSNYPNPFNPVTIIEYSVLRPAPVAIDIFNVLGRKVRTLVNESKAAGSYRIEWSGSDDAGRPVATGVYLYRFQAGEVVQTKKMLLLK